MSAAQKILVADDSLTIRKLVESVLTQQGYEVITAETAAACLAIASEKKPDLILLDYVLPDKQGTELCRELINSPDTWEIPVLMMSSNGNAIRQLYHDLNNVVDYLTKPFAPSVLTAVIGHVLSKNTAPQNGETSATAPTTPQAATPATAAEAGMPREFMDKVSRLIDLIETRPTVEPSPRPAADANTDKVKTDQPAAAPAKHKARRPRKPLSPIPTSEALLRKIRLAAQKHLRLRIRQIPDWEASLDRPDAEDFLLGRLLAKEVLCDLATDLMRATGMPAEGTGALRCPVGLVALDVVLRHLQNGRLTGELRIETATETVQAMLQLGEVVLLTSNNPRNYCAGATCDFQAVPHTIIGEAVRAQEEQSVPFFISLEHAGHLPAGTPLDELLIQQGTKSFVRAFKTNDATIAFFPLSRLPAMARSGKLTYPLNQLLLACYRSVDDWFTLERAFTEMDATFVPTHELEDQLAQLQLDPEEERLIAAVRPGRTMQELAEQMDLKPFEICRLLFRFVELGFIRNGPRRDHDERVDEEVVAIAPPNATTAAPEPTPVPQPVLPPVAEPATTASSSPEVSVTTISEPAETSSPATILTVIPAPADPVGTAETTADPTLATLPPTSQPLAEAADQNPPVDPALKSEEGDLSNGAESATSEPVIPNPVPKFDPAAAPVGEPATNP
jgi:CheY-like chemotaxis protein